jgi:hypothetical protein
MPVYSQARQIGFLHKQKGLNEKASWRGSEILKLKFASLKNARIVPGTNDYVVEIFLITCKVE